MPSATRIQPIWTPSSGASGQGPLTASPTGLAAVYRRRQPTTTPLYPIVQHHLETFLGRADEADPRGEGVPRWVERDFRAYLRCGILAHGFARIRCDDCAAERLVAFSCKGRGVCPSCNTRRMVDVAAHLADHVLPHLPVRQWVFSLPKRIRPFLPRNPALAGAVLRILLRAIRSTLRRASPDAPAHAQLGAVSFLHRFGAALNPHFHFHLIVLDGLFAEHADGSVSFYEATHFPITDTQRLERTLQRRVLRLFRRRGLLDEHTVADMLTWRAAGGFSLDASVRIHGTDAAGRERLIRYCARPPFALERLPVQPQAPTHAARRRPGQARRNPGPVRQVFYRPPRPTSDGRTLLVLSPLEFLAALARLIPPPRVHRHRYHGVLAPNARLRARVVAFAGANSDDPDLSTPSTDTDGTEARPATGPVPHPHPTAPSRWAPLLARIYEVFPLRCPRCGASMRILAFLTDPAPIGAILRHLDLPASPPPIAPARAPPQHDLVFDSEPSLVLDQTPAFDPTVPEPVLEYHFDQSTGA